MLRVGSELSVAGPASAEDQRLVESNDPRLTNTRTPSNDSNLVHKTGDESIAGIKTFTDSVVVSGSVMSGGQALVKTNDLRLSDARIPSNNSSLLHTSGDETASGIKTFNGALGAPGTVGASVRPSGTATNSLGLFTGALKITLPLSWSDTRLRMRVKFTSQADNFGFDLFCGGLTVIANTEWERTFAYIVGDSHTNLNYTVRFGHDGSKCCIYVGELATTFTGGLHVAIDSVEVVTGAHATVAEWGTGWAISSALSFGTISSTITNTQIGRYLDGVALVKTDDARLSDTRTPSNDASLVHLAGTETLSGAKTFSAAQTVNTVVDASALIIRSPHGGHSSWSGSQTGAIKIALPELWTGVMLRARISIFDYVAGGGFDVIVSGYTFSGGYWVAPSAVIIADPTVLGAADLSVRFADDGSKATILIGELASTWSYLKVWVRSVEVPYANLTTWATGWSVSLETSSLGTVGQLVQHCVVGRYLDGVALVKTNDSRLSDARTPSNDSSLVHKTGDETIAGAKAFTSAATFTPGLIGGFLQTGSWCVERTFQAVFGASVADQKVDLYFAGQFDGIIEVTITGYWGLVRSEGMIRARHYLSCNGTGTRYDAGDWFYTDVFGPVSGTTGMMTISWDSTNSRWRVPIANRSSSAQGLSVHVRFQSGYAGTEVVAFRDSVGISAAYTDTTVVAAPVTTLPDLKVAGNAGFNNTAPVARQTVTGSRGGNAALASLLTALANYGLVTDSTS